MVDSCITDAARSAIRAIYSQTGTNLGARQAEVAEDEMAYGVGLIGAGPGVAALHVPTLARLAREFRVVHVADSGSGRSDAIAEQVGARSSRGIDELLADPEVEVVAICSPPGDHAAQ